MEKQDLTYQELAVLLEIDLTKLDPPQVNRVQGGWACYGCSVEIGRHKDANGNWNGPTVRHENSHAVFVCKVNKTRKAQAETGDNGITAVPN